MRVVSVISRMSASAGTLGRRSCSVHERDEVDVEHIRRRYVDRHREVVTLAAPVCALGERLLQHEAW